MEDNKENEGAEPVKYNSLQLYEGAKYKTLYTRKYIERKPWIPVDPHVVKSFIPGTIRKIFVKEGQKVKKGETLLILEAMKMMNELIAPMAGVVKIVHAKTGTIVANKQILVEIEDEKKLSKK